MQKIILFVALVLFHNNLMAQEINIENQTVHVLMSPEQYKQALESGIISNENKIIDSKHNCKIINESVSNCTEFDSHNVFERGFHIDHLGGNW